ncbi:restriction endonuclease [Bradyrhizobium genosp. L]|uniref:restriction endonuclease n=1 Tax=Bradyrhizobium genosp. L TaxID=83637 RepID=UPI0018A33340|nr:restriction endonuclease [Bradyrhizobium genosp. L]QPF85590.1 restriction endonuclease [Bradyrhizobium genosp. L]
MFWNYQAQTQTEPVLESVFASRQCPCCRSHPQLCPADERQDSDGRRFSESVEVLTCSFCGWWFAFKDMWDSSCGSVPDRALRTVQAGGAALATFSPALDQSQIGLLAREIEQHLLGRGSADEWATLEDASAAILREFGYEARGTARSKDGGVDIVVQHPRGGPTAIYAQIKHTRNKVGVRVLRELIGTMGIHATNSGLLVTSSVFTAGVFRETEMAAQSGFFVELVDGARLLASLRLTYRTAAPTVAEILDVARPNVIILSGEFDV